MKSICLKIVHFVLAAVFAPHALGAVSEIVVFGDSLSDNGNVNSLTFGIVPSDDYFESRVFSNGAPWVRFLAQGLDVANPDNSQSDTPIATNYAYGGAKSGTGGESFASVIVRNVAEQIDEFIADERSLTASSLVVLWIGGNDLNGTSSSSADSQIRTTIANVRSHLNELIELGALQILVPNVPLLGEVPQHNGNPSERQQQNTLTNDYNDALAELLLELELENPDVRIVRLDIAGTIRNLIENPDSFGFVNLTDQAYTPGFLGGTIGSSTVPNPDEYVFWDDLHPTGPVHRLLGELAAAEVNQLPLPVIETITHKETETEITFQSKSWASYHLERSLDLITWDSVTESVAGTGADLTLIDTSVNGAPRGFYRVRVNVSQ